MFRLIFLIGMFSFTGSTGIISHLQSAPEIKGYNFKHTVPIPKMDGGFIFADTRYDVFYYKNLVLFKVYYTFDSSLNNRSLLREERTYNFVFNKDSIYGQAYSQYPYFGKTRRRIGQGK